MPALVALSMLGSACDDGGDAPATTGDDAPTCDASLDSDNDGLDDCREAELGTAPHLADTDGDAFTDYQEVVEFGFSSANNNFKFNPLIADTPRIAVDITSAPSIALLYESSTGQRCLTRSSGRKRRPSRCRPARPRRPATRSSTPRRSVRR